MKSNSEAPTIEKAALSSAVNVADDASFFRLLDSLEGFVYLQDSSYNIRYTNKKCREMFGERNSRPCFTVLQNRDKPCEVCPTFKVFDSKKYETWTWQRKPGELYRIYDYPYVNDQGELLVVEQGILVADVNAVDADTGSDTDGSLLEADAQLPTMTYKTLMAKLSQELQERRKLKGLSQADVAEKVGISQRHYQRIERGQQNPSFYTLYILCLVLEIPLQKLAR